MFWKIIKSELRGSRNEAIHLWVEYRVDEGSSEPDAVEDFDAPSEWTRELIAEDLDKHAKLFEPKVALPCVDPSLLLGLSGSSRA